MPDVEVMSEKARQSARRRQLPCLMCLFAGLLAPGSGLVAAPAWCGSGACLRLRRLRNCPLSVDRFEGPKGSLPATLEKSEAPLALPFCSSVPTPAWNSNVVRSQVWLLVHAELANSPKKHQQQKAVYSDGDSVPSVSLQASSSSSGPSARPPRLEENVCRL